MSWDAARAALDGRLVTMAGLSVSTQVAWPGQSFTPPASGLWYAVALLPAGTDAALGPTGSKHEQGVYQVSVFGAPGSGTGALLAAADAVVAHFDRQLLSGLQCGVPTIGPVLVEPEWLHLPVSISFWNL